MGHTEGLGGSASIPPPGWAESTASPVMASVTVPHAAVAASDDADAAVRWRISAAIIDNFIVYGAYLTICLLLHWRVATLGHWLVLLMLGVAYHFVLEARDGQTVGKRQYGIRVVSIDGGPPSPGGIALRSVLRLVDQLPLLYCSGLINMIRTGPARRQRIGDVAGGTMVVAVGGRSAARGTPGWLLPSATMLAFVVSLVFVWGVLEYGKQPLSSTQTARFIAGCERGPASQLFDCGCVLSHLEADGYVTLDSLAGLVNQARSEQFVRQPGAASRTVATAVSGCRR
jgi:uncharacterized RDD family membrane protein YckC